MTAAGKKLRSGFTTGANCAAAAKAALVALTTGTCPQEVEIPFPGGARHRFHLHSCTLDADRSATACVIKDAGDDPDVTDGAEICVSVRFGHDPGITPPRCLFVDTLQLCAGAGIGHVTKPGLACKPGEPAINPGPRQMIRKAIAEVTAATGKPLSIVLAIPKGEELAKETLNARLGIVGGLSVLGTTGVVRPVSASAWCATIAAAIKVARCSGYREIMVSTGRTSEQAGREALGLAETACIEMGDYLKFTLAAAGRQQFTRIHYSGMWAKVTKAALRVPQTHVRNGALEMVQAAALLKELGAGEDAALFRRIEASNTAREMYHHLHEAGRSDIIEAVCRRAKAYCEELCGLPVHLFLVGPGAKILVEIR